MISYPSAHTLQYSTILHSTLLFFSQYYCHFLRIFRCIFQFESELALLEPADRDDYLNSFGITDQECGLKVRSWAVDVVVVIVVVVTVMAAPAVAAQQWSAISSAQQVAPLI